MTILFLIGRILLGGFFIYNGFMHLYNLRGLTGYAAMKKVPLPKTAVAVSGAIFLLGGLSIITGLFMILGMMLLALCLIVVTVTMHNFWASVDPQHKAMELVQFTKNLALIGALLIFISLGLLLA